MYTGELEAPEKNQGMRVFLDMTKGLSGHNITCVNFFTSQKLGHELLKGKLMMVETVQKKKTESTSAVDFTEQACQLFQVCVHGHHIPGVLHAKERQNVVLILCIKNQKSSRIIMPKLQGWTT